MRLDHVVIAVTDFERSNAFYRDVLGAEIVEIDGRVAYRISGQQLNVHGPGVRPAMVARVPVAAGNSDLCFEWDGPIEKALEHLRARGVTAEAGPMTRGGRKVAARACTSGIRTARCSNSSRTRASGP